MYKTIGIISQAINDITSAIQYSPDKIMFYDNRAYLYAKNKQYALAIKDYNMILMKDRNNESAKRNKELCIKKMNRNRKSCSEKIY